MSVPSSRGVHGDRIYLSPEMHVFIWWVLSPERVTLLTRKLPNICKRKTRHFVQQIHGQNELIMRVASSQLPSRDAIPAACRQPLHAVPVNSLPSPAARHGKASPPREAAPR